MKLKFVQIFYFIEINEFIKICALFSIKNSGLISEK